MTWVEAEMLLRENIKVNDALAGAEHYKIVIEVPPYRSSKYADLSFKIKIGKNDFIDVPLSMLESIYLEIEGDNNIYNKEVFERLYPHEIYIKPCYVHTIGKLFVKAGIMNPVEKRSYIINT